MLQSAPAVAGSSARLFLDEIGAPVVARVTHASPERMTVRRALPFLKLHSSVHDEDGRRAQVASVSVVIENGTPELVLELAYDRQSEAVAHVEPECSSTSRRDATVPYVFDRSVPEPRERPARLATKREATLQFVTVRASLERGEPQLLFEPPRPWLVALRWLAFSASTLIQALGRSFARLSRASS
jgi:hypothetical protein